MSQPPCPTCGQDPCVCPIPAPPETLARAVELQEQIREAQRRFFATCAESLQPIPAVLEVLEKGLRQIRAPLRGQRGRPGPLPESGTYPTREAFLADLHRAIHALRADAIPPTQPNVLKRCQTYGANIDLRQFQRYFKEYVTDDDDRGWNVYVLEV